MLNAEPYRGFLKQLATTYKPHPTLLIHDTASYHNDQDVWAWFRTNREWRTVYPLPPYAPDLNATERVGHHTCRTGTHTRYCLTKDELVTTLTTVFRRMQAQPHHIRGYLAPFV